MINSYTLATLGLLLTTTCMIIGFVNFITTPQMINYGTMDDPLCLSETCKREFAQFSSKKLVHIMIFVYWCVVACIVPISSMIIIHRYDEKRRPFSI
jgi:hypothetical protein